MQQPRLAQAFATALIEVDGAGAGNVVFRSTTTDDKILMQDVNLELPAYPRSSLVDQDEG